MKVICIMNSSFGLTAGKIYETNHNAVVSDGSYYMLNDNKQWVWFHNKFFIPIKEYRKLKLQKINETKGI